MHSDPIAAVVLSLAIILACAKLGGDLAVRLGQPSVLGELMAGIVLGNLHLVGVHALDALAHDSSLDTLARLGVIVLLFQVGLESTVTQMLKVGASALLVATIGVVVPFALGYFASVLLLPQETVYAHVFVAATLCATSVGITARVFQDLGAGDRPEARIVLGAAVIDDVQGLIVLAVVTGVIGAAATGGAGVSFVDVGVVVGKATLFLAGAFVLGIALSKRLFKLASRLHARGVLLATGLSFCFVLAWAADAIGLAPIVGAFAAGLILEDAHSAYFKRDRPEGATRGDAGLEELVAPISSLLAPVFFVLMGARTDLSVFADPAVLGVGGALALCAIAGKLAAGLGARGGADRLTVGIGMIPRGEVGLIFANVGLRLHVGDAPVVSARVFSALVATVVVTTLVTPPLLRWSLRRAA